MRIAYSVFGTLLMVSAIPSVSFAQVVIPYERDTANQAAPLERIVPVATVTLPAEAIALNDPQVGHGFVIGAANLDLKDRAHPMVVFTISNTTQTAIPLSNVGFRSVRVNLRVADSRPSFSCGVWSQLSQPGPGDRALPPGAAITVTMPVAPMCPELGETVGFLVFLEMTPKSPLYKIRKTDALLHSAFQMLREAQE